MYWQLYYIQLQSCCLQTVRMQKLFQQFWQPRLDYLLRGLCSYVVSNILNSKILISLKEKYYDKLFVRCIFSTVVGEAVDSIIFISVAFLGVFSLDLIATMICCQVLFKSLYELVCYPVTRKVIFAIRNIDDGELKGQI